MRTLDKGAADSYAVGDVEVTRWEQFALRELMPFDAMWYVVPPGSSSPIDCHPELELSLVVGGVALVHAGGEAAEVRTGGAFLLEGDEEHWVRNPSDDEPLVVFSAYWLASEDAPVAIAQRVRHA